MIDLSAGEDGRAREARLAQLATHAISQPLVTHIYTADPSAHVFEGRVYIYPSHDIDGGQPFDDEGGHFGMQDYHVLRMDTPDSAAVDCGCVLHVRDVAWARSRCGRLMPPVATAATTSTSRPRMPAVASASAWPSVSVPRDRSLPSQSR